MISFAYLVGPASENKWEAFVALGRAGDKLIKDGWAVFCPLRLKVLFGARRRWESFNRDFLSNSSRFVVLTLPGWENSQDVRAEIDAAKRSGIPVEFMEPV